MEQITETMDANECPICLLQLDIITNCIITQCGHKFHASCFTRHAIRNNANCPCCRQCILPQNNADVESRNYDDYDTNTDYSTESESEDDDVDYDYDFTDGVMVENAGLRALRFMYNQLEETELDPDDGQDESLYTAYLQDCAIKASHFNEATEATAVNKCIQGFKERGVTYKDIVAALLASHINNEVLYKKRYEVHHFMARSLETLLYEHRQRQAEINSRQSQSAAYVYERECIRGEIDADDNVDVEDDVGVMNDILIDVIDVIPSNS